MITKIIKRDGREESFSSFRITRAIFLAAEAVAKEENTKADFTIAEQLTEKVVQLLNRRFIETIPTVEDVQDAVVKVLIEEGHAKTSEKYILYREARSKARSMKTRLMKAIEEITFHEANQSNLKRENANIDGNTAMGTMLQYGSAVSKEFYKTNLLDPKHTKMHEEGDIHIHDLDFYNMGTLTCCQIDLSRLFKHGFSTGHGHLREPQDIASYTALAAIAIQSNQNDQHGGQSIPAFDYYLADGVAKTFRRTYRSNTIKAMKIIYGNVAPDCDDKIKEFEKQVGLYAKIEMHSEYLKKFNEFLVKELKVKTKDLDKINKFAYSESLAETDKRTFQAMEGIVHNLNTMHSRAGAQVPFSSINFGTDISPEGRMVTKNLLLAHDAGLGNGETPIFPILIFKVKESVNYNPEDPNYDLFKLACRVSAKRLFPNFSFIDAPFNISYYKPGNPDTEVTYMGCRTRVLGNINGDEVVTRRGNISFTSINLPRLGLKHGVVLKGKFDEAGFFKDLDDKMETVKQQLLERLVVQGSKKVKNFPFLMGQHLWMGSENLGWEDTLETVVKHGTLTIGFIGLAECLKALIGEHHGESEKAQELGLQIVRHMRKRCDEFMKEHSLNFSLIATPAEGLSGRFTALDKKIYGTIEGITDKEYYTNSFHIPVSYKISAYDKLQKEAPYHALTNAGHISYVEIDGDPLKNLEAFEDIIRYMKECNIGYGSINHPVDRDSICGYTGVIQNSVCPSCKREEKNGPKFERIRRITGYLVGTLDNFNDSKAAEERDRVKHA